MKRHNDLPAGWRQPPETTAEPVPLRRPYVPPGEVFPPAYLMPPPPPRSQFLPRRQTASPARTPEGATPPPPQSQFLPRRQTASPARTPEGATPPPPQSQFLPRRRPASPGGRPRARHHRRPPRRCPPCRRPPCGDGQPPPGGRPRARHRRRPPCRPPPCGNGGPCAQSSATSSGNRSCGASSAAAPGATPARTRSASGTCAPGHWQRAGPTTRSADSPARPACSATPRSWSTARPRGPTGIRGAASLRRLVASSPRRLVFVRPVGADVHRLSSTPACAYGHRQGADGGDRATGEPDVGVAGGGGEGRAVRAHQPGR